MLWLAKQGAGVLEAFVVQVVLYLPSLKLNLLPTILTNA